jgi:hypothetical protein
MYDRVHQRAAAGPNGLKHPQSRPSQINRRWGLLKFPMLPFHISSTYPSSFIMAYVESSGGMSSARRLPLYIKTNPEQDDPPHCRAENSGQEHHTSRTLASFPESDVTGGINFPCQEACSPGIMWSIIPRLVSPFLDLAVTTPTWSRCLIFLCS